MNVVDIVCDDVHDGDDAIIHIEFHLLRNGTNLAYGMETLTINWNDYNKCTIAIVFSNMSGMELTIPPCAFSWQFGTGKIFLIKIIKFFGRI